MAKLYRTPNVLDTLSRKSRRRDSSGELLDNDKDVPTEAPNVLSRVLKTLDSLVEEEMKKTDVSERKALTQSWLGREAQTNGTTYSRYAYLFGDTIEMLNKYYLCVLDRDKAYDSNKNEYTIPDFETLDKKMSQKIFDLIMGTFDELADFPIERYGEFASKVDRTVEAYTAFISDGLRIHPAFAGHGLNELTDLLQKKYDDVQRFQAEYDRLEKLQ